MGGKVAEAAAVAKVVQFDHIRRDLSRKEVALDQKRQLFICSVRVPRSEMRTFLEQCEQCVYTTGDQSLAEAMLMDKLPCIQPDAKVQQWQLALAAKHRGSIDAVPDLGKVLRRLVQDEEAREMAKRSSKQRSDAIEKEMVANLGAPPEQWNATHQVLARAGMLG